MLLAAAFVSYAGPFTSKFRAQLIKEWIKFLTDKGAPMTAGISDPLKVLVDDATVASWVREGLPSDPTSVQNGTILTNSERWPLMMDPQLQVCHMVQALHITSLHAVPYVNDTHQHRETLTHAVMALACSEAIH